MNQPDKEQYPLYNLRERRQTLFIASGLAAALLFGALLQWPYGYFVLLRWIVMACALLVGYVAYLWGKLPLTFVFGFVALLFNPVIPVHLSRGTWVPIDVMVGLAFLAGMLVVPFQRRKEG